MQITKSKTIKCFEDIRNVSDLLENLNSVPQEVLFNYENERMHILLDCEKVTFNPKTSAKLGITNRIIDETNSINKIYRGQSKVFCLVEKPNYLFTRI